MTAAYVDGASGASGDMLLAAVLDAGWLLADLQRTLEGFALDGWTIHVERVLKQHIAATSVTFTLPATQPLRHLDDMLRLLAAAGLAPTVRERSEQVLQALARAEAAVHRVPVTEIHFHEIGALDTLFDVVGVVAGLEALGVQRLAVGPINVGGGVVQTAHGRLPVPPPAVALLTRDLITYGTADAGELLTPTGAALLATLGTPVPAQPPMRITAAGYGAGRRDLPNANVVRLLLGPALPGHAEGNPPSAAPDRAAPQPEATPTSETLLLLSTNVDDMGAELYPYILERLLEAGALDAWLTPIVMKKGRPAILVSALSVPDTSATLRGVFFRETTTLGVRTTVVQRERLDRRWEQVSTAYGTIRVKVGSLGPAVLNRSPEYEDCAAAARRHGVPLKEVYAAAQAALPPVQPDGAGP